MSNVRSIMKGLMQMATNSAKFVLDPNDPIEARLIEMVILNRAKRNDYATNDNPFQNFELVAAAMALEGYDRVQDALSMVIRKTSRIVNLRGRDPSNESLLDSWKDMALYAVLGWAMVDQEQSEAEVSDE